MAYHFHLTGLVQGVGFRPFVWQLARSMGVTGQVSNGVNGVHIYVGADADTARTFLRRVQAEAPKLARIESAIMETTVSLEWPDFSIVESESAGTASLLLTPDFALCPACRADLSDSGNRRFGYAFTTCTHCGPRYSILQGLPYDRPATTMEPFSMCADCEAEYNDPADRRFFAQTNSCPNCPVSLRLFTAAQKEIVVAQDTIIQAVVDALRAGQIVAAKGIGGYLLLADATNAATIGELRARKHRPAKPLAVLYPDPALLAGDCYVKKDELLWLTDAVSPIVLLPLRSNPASGLATNQLTPGLSNLGVMLPYAPLLASITDSFGGPLVATSGNLSGSPICYTDERALTDLAAVADLILMHNRVILMPQDDSVMRLSPRHRQPVVLRRARGLAPTIEPLRFSAAQQAEGGILALGASMKSTFAWQLRGNTYVSQYLGDLESFDTQVSFRHTLAYFQSLFAAKPALLLADRHEGYFSTQLAHELGLIWGIPVVTVQHHEAHLAAVLADNNLAGKAEPVLCVVWDGTGYGTDGQLWGGEFMIGQSDPDTGYRVDRIGHFAYFDALLGDKMPREPRLSALSLAHELPGAAALLRPKFTADEWAFFPKLLARNTLKTSSVGRLFDAVAALLGLADCVSYEGEAALLLEDRATRFVATNGFPADHYLPAAFEFGQVPTQAIVTGVLRDVLARVPTNQIAARFHGTLVRVVAAVAQQTASNQLAFSGGVFQNALLVDWLHHELGGTHGLYFHRQLPPNDECISVGQLAHYAAVSVSITQNQQKSCV